MQSGFPATRLRLSQLRKLRKVEQVAAVCYRIRSGTIEFLLVRTRGAGRWTFPKGSVEGGLTHAQAAAIEAFEEAGVHGRMEEASFAAYRCHKARDSRRAASKQFVIRAHLCEVLRLSSPKESGRNRTWFTALEAKHRLGEGREHGHSREFARIVDRAVARIQRLRGDAEIAVLPPDRLRRKTRERAGEPSNRRTSDRTRDNRPINDPLQKVQFEAPWWRSARVHQILAAGNGRQQFKEIFPSFTARPGHAMPEGDGETLPAVPRPFARTLKLLPGAKRAKPAPK